MLKHNFYQSNTVLIEQSLYDEISYCRQNTFIHSKEYDTLSPNCSSPSCVQCNCRSVKKGAAGKEFYVLSISSKDESRLGNISPDTYFGSVCVCETWRVFWQFSSITKSFPTFSPKVKECLMCKPYRIRWCSFVTGCPECKVITHRIVEFHCCNLPLSIRESEWFSSWVHLSKCK